MLGSSPGHTWRRSLHCPDSVCTLLPALAHSDVVLAQRDPAATLCCPHLPCPFPRIHFSAPSPHSTPPTDTSMSPMVRCSQYCLSARRRAPVQRECLSLGARREARIGGASCLRRCRQKHKCFCSSWQGPAVLKPPFHQWVLGPKCCLFEYVHSAFHILSPG